MLSESGTWSRLRAQTTVIVPEWIFIFLYSDSSHAAKFNNVYRFTVFKRNDVEYSKSRRNLDFRKNINFSIQMLVEQQFEYYEVSVN